MKREKHMLTLTAQQNSSWRALLLLSFMTAPVLAHAYTTDANARAANGSLHGTITQTGGLSSGSLELAICRVANLNCIRVMTDASGAYRIASLEPGRYTIAPVLADVTVPSTTSDVLSGHDAVADLTIDSQAATTPPAGSTTQAGPATTATTAAVVAAAAPASLAISAPASAPLPKFLAEKRYSVSGLVDAYYDGDLNHPDSGNTQLRNFDIRANTVSLTEAKLVLAYDPAPFGIRVDLGLGSAFELMHPANPSGGGLKYVEQMFVSVKPAKWKGFQADFGQFVTSAGAEVIESGDNWNYSRSFLFAYAIPYYHFGLRVTMPVTPTITAGVQVVQGWNNIFDNNSGKTIGLTAVQAKKYYTLSGNYYTGPENNDTTHGWRNLIDTNLLLTPTARFNAYINYDYGQNRGANATNTGIGALDHWQGIAAAGHAQVTSKLTATVRGEYFNDITGFNTGTPQKLKEVTLTSDYLIKPGLLLRGEYRHDNSNVNFFDKRQAPASVQSQSTFEIAIIAFFGPKT